MRFTRLLVGVALASALAVRGAGDMRIQDKKKAGPDKKAAGPLPKYWD